MIPYSFFRYFSRNHRMTAGQSICLRGHGQIEQEGNFFSSSIPSSPNFFPSLKNPGKTWENTCFQSSKNTHKARKQGIPKFSKVGLTSADSILNLGKPRKSAQDALQKTIRLCFPPNLPDPINTAFLYSFPLSLCL